MKKFTPVVCNSFGLLNQTKTFYENKNYSCADGCSFLLITNKSFSQLALNGKSSDFVHTTSLVTNTGVNATTNAFNLTAVNTMIIPLQWLLK